MENDRVVERRPDCLFEKARLFVGDGKRCAECLVALSRDILVDAHAVRVQKDVARFVAHNHAAKHASAAGLASMPTVQVNELHRLRLPFGDDHRQHGVEDLGRVGRPYVGLDLGVQEHPRVVDVVGVDASVGLDGCVVVVSLGVSGCDAPRRLSGCWFGQ